MHRSLLFSCSPNLFGTLFPEKLRLFLVFYTFVRITVFFFVFVFLKDYFVQKIVQ